MRQHPQRRAGSEAPARRRSKGRALAHRAALVALVVGVLAAPSSAHHRPVGTATFPGSNWRCTDAQQKHLRAAWQEAYEYVARGKAQADYIASQPTGDERRRLWEQDFRGYGNGSTDTRETPSPERYFGAYDHARLGVLQQGLRIARRRFEGHTMYLVTCSTVCPDEEDTFAHHIVVGRIVTCPEVWKAANDTSETRATRLDASALALVHEGFHHINVEVGGGVLPIDDYHADGAGGHPDKK